MSQLTYLAQVAVILGQLAYWLYHRQVTAEMDAKVWDACVRPGGANQ